jgi:predicted RNA-binding protein with TRAM domain
MKKSQRQAKKRLRNAKRCPVQIGNEYEVDIAGTTPNGSGIARIKNFIILIKDTKLGDHLKIIITKIDSLNAEAEIVK